QPEGIAAGAEDHRPRHLIQDDALNRARDPAEVPVAADRGASVVSETRQLPEVAAKRVDREHLAILAGIRPKGVRGSAEKEMPPAKCSRGRVRTVKMRHLQSTFVFDDEQFRDRDFATQEV